MNYQKSLNYGDLAAVYAQCSGPGGVELAEYMAEKMGLKAGTRLVDIGFNRGLQTCFLAKEYGVNALGVDPWNDRETGIPHIEFLMKNARKLGVADRIMGIRSGVPESLLPSDCFDFAYSTTTLEMVRGFSGMDAYEASLREIFRILKKGGIFGLGEPMHYDAPVPQDLAAYVKNNMWENCFATLEETKLAVLQAGFQILEAEYCADSDRWWREFAAYDPTCSENSDDCAVIRENRNRWLSFGCIIARK